jgi:hypothetical protein
MYSFHHPTRAYIPCPSHSPWLSHSNYILAEGNKLWSSSLCSFLQSPVTSSLLDPNIFLSPLFSNTLSVCSSLNFRDQVSHPHKTWQHGIDFEGQSNEHCLAGQPRAIDTRLKIHSQYTEQAQKHHLITYWFFTLRFLLFRIVFSNFTTLSVPHLYKFIIVFSAI